MTFLKDCNLAVSGNFGDRAPLSKIQAWIAAAGGNYVTQINETVTHLVCSHEHFRRQAPAVKEALKHPRLKIVNFDWLEECLYHRRRRAVRDEHLVGKQIAARRAAKEKRRAARPRKVKETTHEFIASLAQVSRSLGTPGYQISTDQLGGFAWDALLIKTDDATLVEEDPGRESIRTLRIRIVETLEEPKHFGAYADYRGAGTYFTEVLCSPPRPFADARKAFEDYFYDAVGYEWSRRHLNFEMGPKKWTYTPPIEPSVLMLPEPNTVVVVETESDEDAEGAAATKGSEQGSSETAVDDGDRVQMDVSDVQEVQIEHVEKEQAEPAPGGDPEIQDPVSNILEAEILETKNFEMDTAKEHESDTETLVGFEL